MKRIETILITSGRNKKFTHKGINPIIQRASSITFDSVKQKETSVKTHNSNQTLLYGRYGTLSHFSLRKSMIELENGFDCVLYPSGVAAITHTILSFINPGDHILITQSAYGPTQKFCQHLSKKINTTTTYFNPLIGIDIIKLIQDNTQLIILESPGSITMEVQNIPEIVQGVKSKKDNIVIISDNTWSAGIFFKPLNVGVDVSIQSGTKYILGHSDAMLGVAVSNSKCWNQLQKQSHIMGQIIDADTAYMASRGLRTLHVRLKQHESNGLYIANWLSNHPKIACVNHPALPSCKGHEYFIRDFSGSSGLFSFILKKRLNNTQLANFLDNFRYFKIAYSWGGFESLITTYHTEELNFVNTPNNKLNFTGTLVRIHVGLEHPDDLMQDLSDGLDRIK